MSMYVRTHVCHVCSAYVRNHVRWYVYGLNGTVLYCTVLQCNVMLCYACIVSNNIPLPLHSGALMRTSSNQFYPQDFTF